MISIYSTIFSLILLRDVLFLFLVPNALILQTPVYMLNFTYENCPHALHKYRPQICRGLNVKIAFITFIHICSLQSNAALFYFGVGLDSDISELLTESWLLRP